jgi:PleD family two-component response regulator
VNIVGATPAFGCLQTPRVLVRKRKYGMALILVIDDAFYRNLIRRILEREGHSILEAEDGLDGIRLHRQ